ncbi:Sister chromatid cohesion protein 2 [Coemansia sp. RSA 1646]|nr:Sister chromatid cohesion protein 2 [Coemansia sp. RSA 1646]
MKSIYTGVPADTRRCLQYWPVTSATSIDASTQTHYEGVIDDELALGVDFEKLTLLDDENIQDPMVRLVEEVLSGDELQNITEILANDMYKRLYSYIQRSSCSDLQNTVAIVEAKPHLNVDGALDVDDMRDPRYSGQQGCKRESDVVDGTKPTKVMRVRQESPTQIPEQFPEMAYSKPETDYLPDSKSQGCAYDEKDSIKDDLVSVRSMGLLDDFLQQIFQEDDALSEDGKTASVSIFRIIPRPHGNTTVLSKRTIRRLSELINMCAPDQMAKHILDDKISRLVDLLVSAVDTAEGAGLADVIRDGSVLERGVQLSTKYCQSLDACMSISCLGLEASALILELSASSKASNNACNGDSIHTAIAFFKGCLLNCVVPILDLDPESELACTVADRKKSIYSRIQSLLASVLSASKSVISLVNRPTLIEQDVISLVFASLGVLFCSSELLGQSTDANIFESVRRSAQFLLGRIFELYSDQRAWILEEILACLIKLPSRKHARSTYRVPGGKSVQFITVLLLRMLQGTAQSPADLTVGFEGHDLSIKEYRILLERHQKAIDSAFSSTDFTIRYLLSRCAKREGKVMTNEAEYRAFVENFIDDCILLLGHPQWPAAELVVRIYSLHALELLDEDKSDITLKILSLESTAQIASHIACAQQALDAASKGRKAPVLIPLTLSSSAESIKQFHTTTATLISHLQAKAGSNESTGAISLYISNWASILIAILLKIKRLTANQCASDDNNDQVNFIHDADTDTQDNSTSAEDSDSGSEYDATTSAGPQNKKDASIKTKDYTNKRRAIEACLKGYMDVTHRSDKAMVDNVTVVGAADAAKTVFSLFPLYRSFDMLLTRVTMALGASQVTLRSKALRALNQIASHRPSVLYQANVKYAINHRLQDSSPQVREAAIDLIGRHIAQNPELTNQYYEFVSVRVLDKGPSVRKRVMRILRDIYLLSQDQKQLVDIGIRILQRTSDEERTIRELATKIMHELWFTYEEYTAAFGEDTLQTKDMSGNIFNLLSPDSKQTMMRRVRVMTGVIEVARTRELTDLVANLFDHVTSKAAAAESDEAIFVVRCVIDALFEQLLQAEESASSAAELTALTTTRCLRFIATLSKIAPEAVGLHAETLGAYLKMTDAADEELLQCVLSIFSNSLLYMPHPSSQFLESFESDLVSLLSSSPQVILSIAVPCLCMLIEKITWNHAKLIRLFRSCVLQLYREQRLLSGGKQGTLSPKNTMRFIILAGLVCRHFDFEQHQDEQSEHFKEIDQLVTDSVPEFMNGLMLFYASESLPMSVQLAAIQMLGQLYIKKPQLALEPRSRAMIDRVYSEDSVGHKLQVTRNFLEFLRADAQRYSSQQTVSKIKDRNVDASMLVGNTGDMGEAGVGASLMQTYLDRIIDVTFAEGSAALRSAGFEVISLVLEQGLAHPLKCVPSLIALSTSSDSHIRTKALKLHQDLNLKYASFIHSRDMDGVRKAYEYQLQVRGKPEEVLGYDIDMDAKNEADRPMAQLQPLYTMIRSKRIRRNEFLASLVKTGDYDSDSSYAEQHKADIQFVRFVAENVAAFDYKCLDEVLHVVFQISTVIAGTGLNLYHQFEADSKEMGTRETRSRKAQQQRELSTRASVCIWILYLLREFLKARYSITEARCSAYNPSDTSARDRSASWHTHSSKDAYVDWSTCPYALKRMESEFEYNNQRAKFQRMVAESLAMTDERSSPSPSIEKQAAAEAQDDDLGAPHLDDSIQLGQEDLEMLEADCDFDIWI